jgi:uncharacterized secreted repeat protein (TIGR03808 family)
MLIDRRILLGTAAGLLVPASSTAAASRGRGRQQDDAIAAADFGVRPGLAGDQTAALQAAIDAAATRRLPLRLPPGRISARRLALRDGSVILGTAGLTEIRFAGPDGGLRGERARAITLADFSIDGRGITSGDESSSVLALTGVKRTTVRNITILGSPGSGIRLEECGGVVIGCHVSQVAQAAIFSNNATGLAVKDNTVTLCGNNGILVWRDRIGEDGTLVAANRISHIRADGGGSGQNGNGINIYRAGNVIVSANHIADCAYSAVRANSGSNVQIIGNNCVRIGEVALYAEFAFQGAVIANNLVDHAATGISVTNFNDGGRIAVVQGNVIRNLLRREHEPVDKRGVGIAVEADTTVTGNLVEGAPSAGIAVGWHAWMRNVAATGNVIRDSGIGFAISGDASAGIVVLANNIIAGARRGAIRTMRGDEAYGPDLIAAPQHAPANVRINANVAH